jgi:hypothetical protein
MGEKIINPADLSSGDGLVLTHPNAQDSLGYSVSGAGDINGDGLQDLIVGAPLANQGDSLLGAGQSYVVFGSSDLLDSPFDLSSLDGSNGFSIYGANPDDVFGASVSSAGDINGDGFGDLIFGAPYADTKGDYSGQSYVVFGQSSPFNASLNVADLNGKKRISNKCHWCV